MVFGFYFGFLEIVGVVVVSVWGFIYFVIVYFVGIFIFRRGNRGFWVGWV